MIVARPMHCKCWGLTNHLSTGNRNFMIPKVEVRVTGVRPRGWIEYKGDGGGLPEECLRLVSPAPKKKAKARKFKLNAWEYADNAYYKNGEIVCEFNRMQILRELILLDNQIQRLKNARIK